METKAFQFMIRVTGGFRGQVNKFLEGRGRGGIQVEQTTEVLEGVGIFTEVATATV